MSELVEYNKRHPVWRNPVSGEVTNHETGEVTKREGLRGRIGGKLAAIRAEREESRERNKEERADAKRAYEEGRRKGRM